MSVNNVVNHLTRELPSNIQRINSYAISTKGNVV